MNSRSILLTFVLLPALALLGQETVQDAPSGSPTTGNVTETGRATGVSEGDQGPLATPKIAPVAPTAPTAPTAPATSLLPVISEGTVAQVLPDSVTATQWLDDAVAKKREIAELEMQMSLLQKRLGEKHPNVVRLRDYKDALSKYVDGLMATTATLPPAASYSLPSRVADVSNNVAVRTRAVDLLPGTEVLRIRADEMQRRVAQLESNDINTVEQQRASALRQLEDELREIEQVMGQMQAVENEGAQKRMAELAKMVAELRARIDKLEARADVLRPAPLSPPAALPSLVETDIASSYNNIHSFLTPNLLKYYRADNYDEADRKSVELAMEYRRSRDNAKREEIRKSVQELAKSTFEQRIAEREKQLEEARKRIDEIQAELTKRKELADKIIERRVADLLDDPDPLSWEFGMQTESPIDNVYTPRTYRAGR